VFHYNVPPCVLVKFQSQNGLILVIFTTFLDIFAKLFQSQNGLILVRLYLTEDGKPSTFQSQNGLILVLDIFAKFE